MRCYICAHELGAAEYCPECQTFTYKTAEAMRVYMHEYCESVHAGLSDKNAHRAAVQAVRDFHRVRRRPDTRILDTRPKRWAHVL